jgi:hypothetical protein
VSPVSVPPEATAGSLLAPPVSPEVPPVPVVLLEVALGLVVAAPVLPAVPVDVAFELPELPETAMPSTVVVASPLGAPLAVAEPTPVLPDVADACASPSSVSATEATGPDCPVPVPPFDVPVVQSALAVPVFDRATAIAGPAVPEPGQMSQSTPGGGLIVAEGSLGPAALAML